MQKHPTTSRFLASRSTFSVSFVLERMPMTWTSLGYRLAFSSNTISSLHRLPLERLGGPRAADAPNLLNELLLGQ